MPDFGYVEILNFLVLLGIFVAGYTVGRKDKRHRRRKLYQNIPESYWEGVTQIFKGDLTDAVNNFLGTAPLNVSTVEMHMIIARVLRNRGDVRESVSLHKKILGMPDLPQRLQSEAQFGLAEDYYYAGLHSHAIGLLTELTDSEGDISKRVSAMRMLRQIYESESNWEEALRVSARLIQISVGKKHSEDLFVHSHYLCEEAEKEIAVNNYSKAQSLVLEARGANSRSARVSMIQASIDFSLGRLSQAVKGLVNAMRLEPKLAPDIIDKLLENLPEDFDINNLRRLLQPLIEDPLLRQWAAMCMSMMGEKQGSRETALKELIPYLEEKPFLQGIQHWMRLEVRRDVKSAQRFEGILSALFGWMGTRNYYSCGNCGYVSENLSWKCSSCQTWGQCARLTAEENKPNASV